MTRVAVVVFCDVETDWRDDRARTTAAEQAVAHALRDADLPVPSNPPRHVQVRHVMDVGTAALNGYLRVTVTPPGWKPWLAAGVDTDDGGRS